MASANIVGYSNQVLKDDKQAIASGFVDISEIANGQEGFWLSKLIPNYDDSCAGDIYIELLDGAGMTTVTYSWYQGTRGKEDGWYTDDDELIGEDVDDVFFAAGSGLWVTGIKDAEFPFAGQVYDADKSITLSDDKQMLANPYPTMLKLAENIEVDAGDACPGDIYIELLDGAGMTTVTYSWYQGTRGKEDGWYTDDDELIGEDVEDIPFEAGAGLWVTGIKDAVFNITSPIK